MRFVVLFFTGVGFLAFVLLSLLWELADGMSDATGDASGASNARMFGVAAALCAMAFVAVRRAGHEAPRHPRAARAFRRQPGDPLGLRRHPRLPARALPIGFARNL